MAEIHLAEANRLFKQTEPDLYHSDGSASTGGFGREDERNWFVGVDRASETHHVRLSVAKAAKSASGPLRMAGREARNPFSAACQAESRSLTLLRSLRRLAPIDQHPDVMKFRLDVIEARMTEIILQFLRGR
jgi:hypothetical protein